jgi:K+-sensing histidine kinase KdpD
MALRLSAFVKGQKRFLGDVAHELGAPISRIQFGLGLAIVKTCVETCHGNVSARNLKPQGFAVTITLKS